LGEKSTPTGIDAVKRKAAAFLFSGYFAKGTQNGDGENAESLAPSNSEKEQHKPKRGTGFLKKERPLEKKNQRMRN